MFAVGSAEPRAEVVKAMATIAGILKTHDESLVIRGHTDARPYKTALYDNWRLSSARAEMAYYMLTRAGVPEAKIQRIEGHADHALRDPAHPLAAENRRIEILLREAKP
jgi:chemotaxis protein MotB